MRFPEPRRVLVHGKVRWLVRTPKVLGGGREYCDSKGAANKRIDGFRQTIYSTTKEFAALPSADQAMLLGLVAQFDGDVRKLKAAAELGAGKLPATCTVSEAIKVLKADLRVGKHRTKNVAHVLDHFELKFGERMMTDVEPVEIERWLNGHDWGPRMYNEARQVLSQLWKHAIRCKRSVTNPVTDVQVRKLPRSLVPIYEPDEAEVMLNGLENDAPELIPAITLSGFGGLRLSETGRLSCEEVRAAMKKGHLEMKTHHAGKTLEARVVPILPNLKAWLEKYLPETGPVLPEKWMQATKTNPDRMGELGRYITRKTGCEWKSNGFRHSFGTYRFKITNDVGQVVDEMGTSIRNFEKHYRKRSQLVTLPLAKVFFAIRP